MSGEADGKAAEQQHMPARNYVLDYLRGVAALMVLLAHWSGIGANPKAQASVLHLSVAPQETSGNALGWLLSKWSALAHHVWLLDIRFASGGVLIFFLVSGFVIPLSVEKHTPLSFGLRRMFRLLPTLWVAIALWLILNAVLQGVGYANGQQFSWAEILANMFLIHDWYWLPSIDLAFWTLLVEVKFYIAMAAMIALAGRISLATIAAMAGFFAVLSVPFFDRGGGNSDYAYMLGLSGETGYWWVFYFYRVVNNASPYILYMLLGTILFLWRYERINTTQTIIAAGMLFAVFATTFLIGPNGVGQTYYVEDGLRALLLISMVLAAEKAGLLNGQLWGLARFLRGAGAISYPMYLIHSLFGMSVIFSLWTWWGNINLALVTGGSSTLLLIWAVHRWIEVPGQRLGAKLAGSAHRIRTRALTPGE